MDERDQERQPIDARPEGTGRLRAGVAMARVKFDRAAEARKAAAERVRGAARTRPGSCAAGSPGRSRTGPRAWGRVAGSAFSAAAGSRVAGVVAAILIAGGGSGSGAGTTEAFVARARPAPATMSPRRRSRRRRPPKPTGPTLHGAPPVFAAGHRREAGVGDGKALGGAASSGRAAG